MISRGPKWRATALLLACLVLAAVGWLGWRGLAAERELRDARTDLGTARSALLDRDLPEARRAVDDARRRTAGARRLTSDPVWRLAQRVPWAGNSFETAGGIARAADDLVAVLPSLVESAEALDPTLLRSADGAIDLALLRRVAPRVADSARRAAAVEQRVQALPSTALVAPVARARADLEQQVAQLVGALDGAAAGLEVAPALLGEDRTRRYLVLLQQTSESRGTGGLPGGYAEVETAKGRVRVVSQGSNAELRNGRIPIPAGLPADWVARYESLGAFDLWQNVNVSPDLPVVATVVEARWRAQGGAPLDGVAVTDAKGIASLLRGSPPIDVGGGRQIPVDQVEQFLAVGQYEGLPAGADQRARKDRLDEVAGRALRRLATGDGDTVALLRGLADAVRSGHLRMASDDPALRPVLERTGVDGALPQGDGPIAFPVVYNSTGGKLEHFLDRRVGYRAGSCAGERRRSIVTTTLRSDLPSSPLPPYLTIRVEDGIEQSRVNRLGLSVYGTRGARLVAATLDGTPVRLGDGSPSGIRSGTEAGLPVWSVMLDLPPGEERTLSLELDEPTAAGPARVPEQPLSRPLVRDVAVPVCAA